MKIKNLEDLRKITDEETIRRIFMEYFMELSGKDSMSEHEDTETAYKAGYAKGHSDAELGI